MDRISCAKRSSGAFSASSRRWVARDEPNGGHRPNCCLGAFVNRRMCRRKIVDRSFNQPLALWNLSRRFGACLGAPRCCLAPWIDRIPFFRS